MIKICMMLIFASSILCAGKVTACTYTESYRYWPDGAEEQFDRQCSNGDCTLTYAEGGSDCFMMRKALEARSGNWRVVVDGDVRSSVTVFLDLLNPRQVCVTKNALVRVHQGEIQRLNPDGTITHKGGFYHHHYRTLALRRLIAQKGGEPRGWLLTIYSSLPRPLCGEASGR